jgi:hypothetical protein
MAYDSPLFQSLGIADPAFAPEPMAKRSWTQALEDTGRAVASGVGGLVKSGGELYGLATGNMNNGASELGDSVQEYWQSGYSPQLQAALAQRKADIDSSEGFGGKAWTALKSTVTNPALAGETAASNLATLVPGLGIGRAASAARFSRGLAAATEAGPAAVQALAKEAGSLGTKAAIGTGAVQQGADVSQAAYDGAMKTPNSVWLQNPEFLKQVSKNLDDGMSDEDAVNDAKHTLALKSARVTFAPAAAISVAANTIPGADLLERAMVGGAARTGSKLGLVRSMGKGMLGEASQEALEEGGGQFVGNLSRKQYVDPNQNLSEDVGENAGMGAAGGALFGLYGGAMHRHAGTEGGKAEDSGKALESGGTVDMIGPAKPTRAQKQRAAADAGWVTPGGPLGFPRGETPLAPLTQPPGTSLDIQFDDFQQVPPQAPQLAPGTPLALTNQMPRTNDPGVLYGTPSGLVTDNSRLVSGEQGELFPGVQPTFGNTGPALPQSEELGRPMPQQSTAQVDARTRDMFPTAPVPQTAESSYPHANFPLLSADEAAQQNPNHAEGQTQSAKNQPTGAITATLGYVRSKLAGLTNLSGAGVLKAAIDLTNAIHTNGITALNAKLDSEQQAIQKARAKTDERISLDPDGIDEDKYIKDLYKLDARQKILDAQRTFLKEHFGGMAVNAARLTENSPIQGSETVSKEALKAGDKSATDLLTQQSDQNAERSRVAKTKHEREQVIRAALSQPLKGQNPLRAAQRALKAAGYTDMNLTASEVSLVNDITSRRQDATVAMKYPPALAAKQGKLTSRESLNEQPKPSEPPVQDVRESQPSSVAAPVTKSTASAEQPKSEPKTSKVPARVDAGAKPEPETGAKPVVATQPQGNKVSLTDLPTDLRRKAAKLLTDIDKYERLLSCLLK